MLAASCVPQRPRRNDLRSQRPPSSHHRVAPGAASPPAFCGLQRTHRPCELGTAPSGRVQGAVDIFITPTSSPPELCPGWSSQVALAQSAWAAVTTYPRLGLTHSTGFLLPALGAGGLRSGCLCMGRGEASSGGRCRSHSVLTGQRALWGPFYQDTGPVHGAPPSCPKHLSRAPTPCSHIGEVGFNDGTWGGTQKPTTVSPGAKRTGPVDR